MSSARAGRDSRAAGTWCCREKRRWILRPRNESGHRASERVSSHPCAASRCSGTELDKWCGDLPHRPFRARRAARSRRSGRGPSRAGPGLAPSTNTNFTPMLGIRSRPSGSPLSVARRCCSANSAGAVVTGLRCDAIRGGRGKCRGLRLAQLGVELVLLACRRPGAEGLLPGKRHDRLRQQQHAGDEQDHRSRSPHTLERRDAP